MRPGDFVITPSMTWHDHGNETNGPMVWLDGLDLALVDLLNAIFLEAYREDRHPVTRPEGAADARFGSELLPVDYERRGLTTPIFNYPYARTREALERMRRGGERDRCHGFKMKYVNPATGDWAMPTISTWMQLLPHGFSPGPIARPTAPSSSWSRATAAPSSAERHLRGDSMTSSSCRAGASTITRRRTTRCSSVSRTDRCKRSLAYGASGALAADANGPSAKRGDCSNVPRPWRNAMPYGQGA